jgi:hypothetical protein
MKKISLWAKFHPDSARIIIVAAHFLLVTIAFQLSAQIARQNIKFSGSWIYIFIVAFFLAALCYPHGRTAGGSKWHYTKRKTLDLVVVSLGFCLFFLVANELNAPRISPGSATALTIKKPLYKNPEAEKLLILFREGQKKSFTKKEKRVIKQEFNYQVKEYAVAKITGDKAKQNTAVPIILCCVAAVGLLFLVASLACSLDCGGSATGALLVGILGTAAVIFGLVVAIKAINRKAQKKMAPRQ